MRSSEINDPGEGLESGEAVLGSTRILEETTTAGDRISSVVDRTVDPEKLFALGKLIDETYGKSINSLREFDLYDHENEKRDDIKAPGIEELKAKILSSVSPEQVEIILGMQRPTLLLVPSVSGERYIKALASKGPGIKLDISQQTKLALNIRDRDEGTLENSISAWSWAIIEGDTEFHELISGQGKWLSERVDAFNKENKDKGISGVTIKQFMLFLMQIILRDNSLNYQRTSTLLNGEPVRGFTMGVGCIHFGSKFVLEEIYENQAERNTRLRPCVSARI